MVRNITVWIFALAAVLLFSSDASACHRSRCCGSGYGYYGTSDGCCGGSGYGYYGTTSSGCCGGSGFVNGSGMATAATVGTDAAGTSAVGVQPGVGVDVGRPGYNPGGIGGPASGIGVRPGVGAGGLGRGR